MTFSLDTISTITGKWFAWRVSPTEAEAVALFQFHVRAVRDRSWRVVEHPSSYMIRLHDECTVIVHR